MKLYFIAVLISDPVDELIRNFQQDFAARFSSSRQLKIPVHITLIPPFKSSDRFIDKLDTFLTEFTQNKLCIDLILNEFGQFNGKTVYVRVEDNHELKSLFSDLKNDLITRLDFNDTYNYSEFTPHVTIANRDLNPENFKLSWTEYSKKAFHAGFCCDSICLLEHDGQKWNVLRRYSFSY